MGAHNGVVAPRRSPSSRPSSLRRHGRGGASVVLCVTVALIGAGRLGAPASGVVHRPALPSISAQAVGIRVVLPGGRGVASAWCPWRAAARA